MFGTVIVPPAVAAELAVPPGGNPAVDARALPFFDVRNVEDQASVTRWRQSLDPGEAEVLALATSLGADRVLIDEKRGRRAAVQAGLPIAGTLAVLVHAKRVGLLSSVADAIDQLAGGLNFFIGEDLRHETLREAGEVT